MPNAEKHPLAGQTVQVKFAGNLGPYEFAVEDWWDHLTGGSWMLADGNPAALTYAMRAGLAGLPTDDEVIYGKIDGLGHLVHASEVITEPAEAR